MTTSSRFMLETSEKCLTLYPDELNTIFGTGDGVYLHIGDVIMHCQIEGTEYWRKKRLILRDAGPASVLVNMFIFEGESYTIRTKVSGKEVLVSKNMLPKSLTNKVGWAFGFTSKNWMTMNRLHDTYLNFQMDYAANKSMLISNDMDPHRPVYKVFSPWLHATYQLDAGGNYNGSAVYWSTDGNPSQDEALDLMHKMTDRCANDHNRSRINYVINQLQPVA
ncbi:MAG: hypothetical protein NC489_08565 [Ruminococcus flavefaciens]|nr:hypothetical protein [Ruminococcus flavefaciens]